MMLRRHAQLQFAIRTPYRNWSVGNGLHTAAQQSPQVRVRYAPSPTGLLHLGGLRTALFNFLFARVKGGEFHIRIEDTDQKRLVQGSAESLQHTLTICGLTAHPNVLVQSQRLKVYKEHSDALIHSRHAYRCFCSPEKLQLMREDQRARGVQTRYDRTCLGLSAEESEKRADAGEPHTVRLNVDRKGATIHDDLVLGRMNFQHDVIDDQVLMKSDGFPTYHLAAVVDDHETGITHVIRGDEWLNSTCKHIMIYRAFGWTPPQFAHLPLLLNDDGSKLSKRQGDVAVQDFLKKGYIPSALINFVALLGWHPAAGDTQELYHSIDELVNVFSLEQVNKSGAVVDRKRLDWINNRHIKELCFRDPVPDSLVRQVQLDCMQLECALPKYYNDAVYVAKVMRLLCDRVSVVPDFAKYCGHFVHEDVDHNNEDCESMRIAVWNPMACTGLECCLQVLKGIAPDSWEAVEIKAELGKVLSELGLKKSQGKLFMPLRWATTGIKVGAALPDTFSLLGRERVLKRLECAIEHAANQRP